MMGMCLLRKIINKGVEYYQLMERKVISPRARREMIRGIKKREQTPSSEIGTPGIAGGVFGEGISGVVYNRSVLGEAISAFASRPNCVNIKIPGKKIVCLKDISEGETIGTLTEKIAYQLGVDKQNWGFYAAGPREFLPDNKKVLEINHDKHLHFLPRMVIR